MIQNEVQKNLNKMTKKFQNNKKMKEDALLEYIVSAMDEVGGITGLYVASNQTLKLKNEKEIYNVPIKYEQHSKNLSAFGKRSYKFFEKLTDYLVTVAEVSKKNIQYHLGRDYSGKHHDKVLNKL